MKHLVGLAVLTVICLIVMGARIVIGLWRGGAAAPGMIAAKSLGYSSSSVADEVRMGPEYCQACGGEIDKYGVCEDCKSINPPAPIPVEMCTECGGKIFDGSCGHCTQVAMHSLGEVTAGWL